MEHALIIFRVYSKRRAIISRSMESAMLNQLTVRALEEIAQ
jgi:hypothetical protein